LEIIYTKGKKNSRANKKSTAVSLIYQQKHIILSIIVILVAKALKNTVIMHLQYRLNGKNGTFRFETLPP